MTDGKVDVGASVFVVIACLTGLAFAVVQFRHVAAVSLNLSESLLGGDSNKRMIEIYEAIRNGADSFLFAEYRICLIFCLCYGTLVFVLTSSVKNSWIWTQGGLTALAFLLGALTSMASGYLGMKVAVFSNARTTVSAMNPSNPWTHSFNTAFRAGGVMGFALCGLGVLMLYIICVFFNSVYHFDDVSHLGVLFECVAGFGLGGSTIALFGRVGGGIYTKAADVGADLAGKVVSGIPEDDPRNPATIADNVGDNVGDVAGMGSDLFGSLAEATCAALVIAASSESLRDAGWTAIMFPVFISCVGILTCIATSYVATKFRPVLQESDVEKVLKTQILVSTVLTSLVLIPFVYWSLPKDFVIEVVSKVDAKGQPLTVIGTPFKALLSIWAGLYAGCAIGYITEYYTSHSYRPTREVAMSCETGAATNIIYGLALGYKSVIIPVFLIALVVYISFSLLDMFGVALAALGMLATLATGLSIDVYGPVCDNAGGIAEMTGLSEEVRDITDALDAAGNTTAAIGKGFAIGSACLVGLALFGAFATRAGLHAGDVSILSPVIFAALLIGAMIPYWFTALTMKSVGVAANEMVKEVKRQFDEIPGLLAGEPGHAPPDHAKCIKISTDASLREMIAPGILVLATPLIAGVVLGTAGVAGLLAGSISSSVQMAISASNTGGAWDNAKKYVEKGCVFIDGEKQGKGSEVHKAAVVGDTVGDPLKDTSGPALNIVMKLMAINSLIFVNFFLSINGGKGLIGYLSK